MCDQLGAWGVVSCQAHGLRPVGLLPHTPRTRNTMDQSLRGFASTLGSLPMPELRKDPIVGRWVIIATDRAKRPVAPKAEPQPVASGFCPFCEGQEDKT